MPELIPAALVLILAIALALIPMIRADDAADKMLAAQLLGTGGVGLLLVFAILLELPGLIDVALMLALLAAVGIVAFTRLSSGGRRV